MKHNCLAISLAATLAVGAISGLKAQVPATGPAEAPSIVASDAAPSDLLGAPFENQAAGIALRIPAGSHRVRSSGGGDDLGQFADEKRNWQVKLTRIIRPVPTALSNGTDNNGQPIVGLLDQTVERLKRELPGCKILRSDLTNVQDGDPKIKDNVGMIAVRYTAAARHYLSQQAIIQSTDRLFYLLTLTAPGSELPGSDADNDPAEKPPVETFRQMIDSVRLLDTTKIAREQIERLVRTRALMVNFTAARLNNALTSQQWIRIIQDGKDIGYSYITEEVAKGVPRPLRLDELKSGKTYKDALPKEGADGILIGVRARSINPKVDIDPSLKAKGRLQVDSASWLFCTPDRRLEDWSRIIVVDTGEVDKDGKPVKSQTEEFGSSSRRDIRTFDQDRFDHGDIGTKEDKHQPPILVREQYTLDVNTVSQSGQGDPVSQDLPPWYLPQAMGHLLPRLLPLHPELLPDGTEKKRSYLFATYVPETREVMHRYIDVRNLQTVTFAGQTMQAIPIDDRIGWSGPATTHYMSPSGVYLGSENKESHLLMLPADETRLLSIWKNADLSHPNGTQRPHGSAQALPAPLPGK